MRDAAESIPMVGTQLAFLGKTYFLVRTLANFRQRPVAKLKLPFRSPRCPEHHHLAQNLSLSHGLSFRIRKIPPITTQSVDGFPTIVFGVFR
jgi:UDP-N-acetylmuramyl pentapeptide phosphotransferase/UDP-N-acetylglucosamine-1-phosphate transferase